MRDEGPAPELTVILEIQRAIDEKGLTQSAAAHIIGIKQPNLSAMLRRYSERRYELERLLLMAAHLGRDVDILVRPTKARLGRINCEVDRNGAPSRPRSASWDGVPVSDKGLGLRARAVVELRHVIDESGLTLVKAAEVIGMAQPCLSILFLHPGRHFTAGRIFKILTLFQRDVVVILRPSSKAVGHLRFSGGARRPRLPRETTQVIV